MLDHTQTQRKLNQKVFVLDQILGRITESKNNRTKYVLQRDPGRSFRIISFTKLLPQKLPALLTHIIPEMPEPGGLGGPAPLPIFVRSVDPLPTGGADSAHP